MFIINITSVSYHFIDVVNMLYYIDFQFGSRKLIININYKYIIYILRFVIYINLYTEMNSLIIDCIRNVLRVYNNTIHIIITIIIVFTIIM